MRSLAGNHLDTAKLLIERGIDIHATSRVSHIFSSSTTATHHLSYMHRLNCTLLGGEYPGHRYLSSGSGGSPEDAARSRG